MCLTVLPQNWEARINTRVEAVAELAAKLPARLAPAFRGSGWQYFKSVSAAAGIYHDHIIVTAISDDWFGSITR